MAESKAREQQALEELVRTMAEALDLPVQPAWVPGIAQQLAVTLTMADLLESVDLAEDAQTAPGYRL